jgi:phosphoribosylformylglycinamidine synthase PurS subunit
MIYRFVIQIERKPGLSDPEGATTARALTDLGFASVKNVSFGRTITIDLDAGDPDEAKRTVESMCSKLLANPVIEGYTIEATP